MAGVTSSGFETKTNDTILNEIRTLSNSTEYFGESFPSDPSSNFYILASLFSVGLKDQWDITKSVVSQLNRDEAEGKWLDDAAALINIKRLNSAPATGSILFNTVDAITIPALTPVKFSINNEVVLTDSVIVTSKYGCYGCHITVPNPLPSAIYSIRLNGNIYTVTAGASPTVTSVTSALIAELKNSPEGLFIRSGDTLGQINISYPLLVNKISVEAVTNLTLNSIDTVVKASSSNKSSITFYQGQVVKLLSPISGVSAVTNIVDWAIGRDKETDEDLRLRLSALEETTGTATKPAIETSVAKLDGVVSTLLVENTEFYTSPEGIPPKSYELFVEGGSDDDIANEIWRTKPAGIKTHGSKTIIIVDSYGKEHSVSFSRFDTQYGWVKVTYQLNVEETSSVDRQALIRGTVVLTGNSFDRGEDLESTKFYGDLYSNVQGIYVVKVETAITPTLTSIPTYSTNRKSVGSTVKLLFNYDQTSTVLQ